MATHGSLQPVKLNSCVTHVRAPSKVVRATPHLRNVRFIPHAHDGAANQVTGVGGIRREMRFHERSHGQRRRDQLVCTHLQRQTADGLRVRDACQQRAPHQDAYSRHRAPTHTPLLSADGFYVLSAAEIASSFEGWLHISPTSLLSGEEMTVPKPLDPLFVPRGSDRFVSFHRLNHTVVRRRRTVAALTRLFAMTPSPTPWRSTQSRARAPSGRLTSDSPFALWCTDHTVGLCMWDFSDLLRQTPRHRLVQRFLRAVPECRRYRGLR